MPPPTNAAVFFAASTRSDVHAVMQHLPMPRATTAAWLVMPPRAVRMPDAAFMPWMSSGDVSVRTRSTVSPRCAHSSAAFAVNTILPIAAPGDAGRPFATGVGRAFGSIVGCSTSSSFAGSMRSTASFGVELALGDEVDGDLHHRLAGALAVARLQHEQLAVLDRELEVLHVAEVILEQLRDAHELGVRRRQLLRELGDRLGRADAGDDVLALRVGQELAVELGGAGRRVARERDAGRAVVAEVAEHHRLHVDRGAHRRRDVVACLR